MVRSLSIYPMLCCRLILVVAVLLFVLPLLLLLPAVVEATVSMAYVANIPLMRLPHGKKKIT
jgi:hypothetical protein